MIFPLIANIPPVQHNQETGSLELECVQVCLECESSRCRLFNSNGQPHLTQTHPFEEAEEPHTQWNRLHIGVQI